MDILGIGPLEFAFILLIALIVLGPNDMVKAGRTLGRLLRKLITSPGWQMVQQTSKDLRYLPNKLMREAGLEEIEELKKLKDQLPTQSELSKDMGLDDLKQEVRQVDKDLSAWTTPAKTIKTPATPLESSPAKIKSTEESLPPASAESEEPPATTDTADSTEPKIAPNLDETDN